MAPPTLASVSTKGMGESGSTRISNERGSMYEKARTLLAPFWRDDIIKGYYYMSERDGGENEDERASRLR